MLDTIDELCNIRAGRYFIARATEICARCGRPSRVLAVGLPPGHQVLEPSEDDRDGDGDDDRDDRSGGDTWATANHTALLFHVAGLSEGARWQLCGLSAAYRKASDAPDVESCWTNHCDHCGAAFEDQDLFCEPGGAFLPVSELDARRIELFAVEESLAADAAGYAQDPDFFDAMRRT